MSRSALKQILISLGTEDALLELIEKFYNKLASDTLVGFFFYGKDLKQIALHQRDFMLHAMGVLQNYSGKIPSRAHTELAPILPGHFDRRITLLREVLEEEGLASDLAETWIQFERSFRDAILMASK